MIDKAIECIKCDFKNSSKHIKIKDIDIKNGVKKRVWVCFECGYQHLILIHNKATRRLMLENKKDRQRISKINKMSRNLYKQGKLIDEQARKALKEVRKIEERINSRTNEIDRMSKKLMDDYVIGLRVEGEQ